MSLSFRKTWPKSALFAGLILLVPLPAEATRYVLSSDSEIRYSGAHPMHRWEGISRSLRGEFGIEAGRIALPIELSVPVRSFSSGNRNRDKHALEVLEAFRHPRLILRAQEITFADRKEADLFMGHARLRGQLAIRGLERPVETVLEFTPNGPDVQFEGRFTIRLSDYGIQRPAFMMIPMEDELGIEVKGRAIAQGP